MASFAKFAGAIKRLIEPISKEYVAEVSVAPQEAKRAIQEIASTLPEGFAVDTTKQIENQFNTLLKNEKAALGFDDFMINAKRYNENYIRGVSEEIGADVTRISEMLNSGKINDAIVGVSDAYEAKAMSNIWEATKLKAQGFIDDASITTLEADATLGLETKIKQLEGYTEKAVSDWRVKSGYNEKDAEPGWFSRMFQDLEGKISNAIETADLSGTPGIRGVLKNLFLLNENSDSFAKYQRDILRGLAGDLRQFDEAKRIGIRRYVEGLSRYSPTEMKGMYANELSNRNDAVWYNPELAMSLGLGEPELRVANKAINTWYTLARKQAELDRGIYSVDDMLPYVKMEERSILRPVTPEGEWLRVSDKDLGVSYWHAEANKEHLATVLAAKKDLAVILDDVEKKNAYFQASRHGRTSDLRLNDEKNRMLPDEEIDAYANQYIFHNIKRRGQRLIDNAINMSAIPIGTTEKSAKGAARQLFDLRNSWEAKFERYQPDLSDKKPTIQKWGEKYAEAMADFHVTLALSSPKLFIEGNWLQSILLGGATKGFANEIAQTFRTTGAMIKAMVGDPALIKKLGSDYHGAMNEISEKMYNGMFDTAKPDTWEYYAKRGFDKFMQRHIELMPTFDQQLESTFLPKQLKYILDIAKIPFQVSDRVSRFAGYAAAIKHAYPHMLQYQKNLASGMKPSEAIATLEKELHFKEFRGVRREYLREFLSVNPDGKMQKASMEEFLAQYADASVKMENFDYSKAGTSFYQDWVRKQNPIVAKAFTFTSFPIYYSRFLNQMAKAYMAGDTAPLLKLAALGTMMTTASYALAEPDKEKRRVWNEWGAYAVNVAPIISMYNVPSRLLGSPLGIMESAASIPLSLATAGLDEGFKFLSGADSSGKVLNAISGYRLQLERSNNKSPVYRWGNENLKEIIKLLEKQNR